MKRKTYFALPARKSSRPTWRKSLEMYWFFRVVGRGRVGLGDGLLRIHAGGRRSVMEEKETCPGLGWVFWR
ncbi:hypothetical protein, partial [Streptomyces sp. SID5770]|uniref:hypothetical protein n=1 Tax=Streptomyces sp. SID5770 TaxID=2690308 RepID=UPI001F38E9D8